MFALCSIAEYTRGIALKCDPLRAVDLREQYTQVTAAYHMSKVHWNDVQPEAGLPDELIRQWIDDSYALVVAKLPKASRATLQHYT